MQEFNVCVHIQIKASPLSPATAILCVSVHVCLCVLSCPRAGVSLLWSLSSVPKPCWEHWEGNLWHHWHLACKHWLNSRWDAPVGLPFLTFSVLAADTVPPQHNGHFCLNFDCGKSFFPFRTHNVTHTNFLHSCHKGCWFWTRWWRNACKIYLSHQRYAEGNFMIIIYYQLIEFLRTWSTFRPQESGASKTVQMKAKGFFDFTE